LTVLKSLDQTEEGWLKMFDVDVKGVFLMTTQFCPICCETATVSIINVLLLPALQEARAALPMWRQNMPSLDTQAALRRLRR
jgi:NAD(P)-dependent dehydrogenase (short-subunit alcohol dehydrogenase family)